MRLTDQLPILPISYVAENMRILIFDQNFDHINISEQFSSHQTLLWRILFYHMCCCAGSDAVTGGARGANAPHPNNWQIS